MQIWNPVLIHLVSGVLIISSFQLVLPLEAQEAGATSAAPRTSVIEQALPDSPGTLQSSNPEPSNSPETSTVQSGTSSSQAPQGQSQSQTASPAQKPVGTAAAESSNTGGIAASQPAGAAIAPAKQRRVRTIVLRLGALAAAGVAVGTVAALNRATPSKPPGAH